MQACGLCFTRFRRLSCAVQGAKDSLEYRMFFHAAGKQMAAGLAAASAAYVCILPRCATDRIRAAVLMMHLCNPQWRPVTRCVKRQTVWI